MWSFARDVFLQCSFVCYICSYSSRKKSTLVLSNFCEKDEAVLDIRLSLQLRICNDRPNSVILCSNAALQAPTICCTSVLVLATRSSV